MEECPILLRGPVDKLSRLYSPDEIEMLMSCQDNNGDTAALVAARNGAFRLVSLLLAQCPRAGDLMNKKGETAAHMLHQYQSEHEPPPPPSSITMANDHIDGEIGGAVPEHQSAAVADAGVDLSSHSSLLAKISGVMADANKKLAMHYGSSKPGQEELNDIANPEALYAHLESDRAKIQQQTDSIIAKEAQFQHIDIESRRELCATKRDEFKSLVELSHRAKLDRWIALHAPDMPSNPNSAPLTREDLVSRFEAISNLVRLEKERRLAVEELVSLTADAGVSPILNGHRNLVSLATGLKEDDLDPIAGELADALEFDRANNASATSKPAVV
ncbi:hypothetical protein N7470_005215 [Penicillium chermesinum]|nr:hypothetical protein N7470_005215 [Penicillium chermesinum]